MCLRFIPYVGAILAAGLPIALAAAVGSDWTMTFLTIALFAIIEPLTGHVVEPVVLRKKCWSLAGCYRFGGIVLDLALGSAGFAPVDATYPLPGSAG